MIGLRKRLVGGGRGGGQNQYPGSPAGRGLPVSVGNRAWTHTGLAALDGFDRPLAGCEVGGGGQQGVAAPDDDLVVHAENRAPLDTQNVHEIIFDSSSPFVV